MVIRSISEEELKKGIFNWNDFPEVFGLPSQLIWHKDGFHGIFINNNLIAICRIKFKKDTCKLCGIEVKDAYQKQGYGKSLITHIENIAKNHNCKYIELVPRDYRVHGFYENLGYNLIKEKLMKKEII